MSFIKMLLKKEMLKSIFFVLKLYLRRKKYDVIFVNSVVFNRENNGDNALFKPLIKTCEELNFKYIIIEDADLKGEYKRFKRNKNAIPFDFISLISTLIRKFNKKKISKFDSFEKEKFVNQKLIKYFLFNLDANIYITLIWKNVTLWRILSPNATITDYQHGIIMNGHSGYLKNRIPPKIKTANKITTLVYSDFIKNILIANDSTKFYSNKNVFTIGVNSEMSNNNKKINKKNILFSLQITPDFSNEINRKYTSIATKLIENILIFLIENKYKLLLKQHPRYNNSSAFNFENENIIFTNDNINNLFNKTKIHITFHSTSAIDAALRGIPTIFINLMKEFSPEDIFFKQYEYPFNELIINDIGNIIIAVKFIENNYMEISQQVYNWGTKINSSFDKEKFKEFLLKKR